LCPVRCRICGKELKAVIGFHLEKHGITIQEYKRRFPDAEIQSKEANEKRRKSNKKYWSNEEVLKRHRERVKQAMSDPSLRRKLAEYQRERMKDPERREAARRSMKRLNSMKKADPEVRAKWERQRLEVLRSEEYRKKRSKIAKRLMSSEERRRRISTRLKELWKSAEYRQMQMRARKGVYTVEVRKKMSMKAAERVSRGVYNSVSSLEDMVHDELKKLGIAWMFYRQFPVDIGDRWVSVDLAIPELKIAVFCDGCYWHSCPICFNHETRKGIRGADAAITKNLKSKGWKVLRFWEHEIKGNLNKVMEKIITCVQETTLPLKEVEELFFGSNLSILSPPSRFPPPPA